MWRVILSAIFVLMLVFALKLGWTFGNVNRQLDYRKRNDLSILWFRFVKEMLPLANSLDALEYFSGTTIVSHVNMHLACP